MSVTQQSIVTGAEVLTALWGAKQLNRAANERISQGFSDPVDAGTGEYLDYRTDFHWPHILPLTLKRAYTGRQRVAGLLGNRWLCNWSQYLEFDSDGQMATYFDANGLCPAYNTEQVPLIVATCWCRITVCWGTVSGPSSSMNIHNWGISLSPFHPVPVACGWRQSKTATAMKLTLAITASGTWWKYGTAVG
jgi:hypothetical protein